MRSDAAIALDQAKILARSLVSHIDKRGEANINEATLHMLYTIALQLQELRLTIGRER